MVRRLVAAALATALLAGLAACTADDSQPPAPDESGGDVALEVVSLEAPGINEETRTKLESELGDVLAGYIVGGFLGDYPREDFVRSLADFTNTLADDGGPDLDVLTLSGMPDVTSVRPTRLHARLSYFTPGGKADGATAFVDLAFDVTLADGTTRKVTRTGKLVLGRVDGDWLVTGYRMRSNDGASVQAETAS